jgi:hypothetical protein
MASGSTQIELPPEGRPVVGMISSFRDLFSTAASKLCAEFGPVLATCAIFPFDFTDYYEAEMGAGLLRTYVIYARPMTEESLREMKSAAEACERQFLYPESDRRMINLDPGLLTSDHLVLASHKSAAHRVYLGDGVYAEIELMYIDGGFQPLPWTYPDYRTKTARVFFEKTRAALLGRTE